MNLWLFDLDGVLIHPGGYREALRRTVAHFSARMGNPERTLDESAIESFEAQGITCEWDIAGICAAADAFAIWRANPELHLPSDFSRALTVLQKETLARPVPEYAGWARRAGALGGESPSLSAAKIFRQEAGHADADIDRVGEFDGLLDALLGHPREFEHSPVMRFFQQFTLGSRTYRDLYGVPADVETPSLLEELDRPAFSAANRDRIRTMQRERKIRAVIVTARPSRPSGAIHDPVDFPPEGEIGAKVIGLEELPLVGAGQMLWLAKQRGQQPDAYLKPNPTHSLAAIALALGAAEGDGLEAARALVEDGKLLPPFDALKEKGADVLVFEDSPTGVLATQSAVDLLCRRDVNAQLSFFGIASGGEKRAALQALGAEVLDTTDEALDRAWLKIG
jgi:phosphoglycolate phosphatase-like HAD superfamily hydrolase